MQTTNTISVHDLQTLLASRRGAQFVTVTAYTDARARKTGNPFGQIFKLSKTNCTVNFNYSNAVNRQRVRELEEGEAFEMFTPLPRKWGERMKGLPFVTHKGRVYLECKPERTVEDSQYFDANGNPLTKEHVAPFLPKESSNADHQGVDKEIPVRTFDMENLRAIAIGGETYTMEGTTIPEVNPALQAA